jgi:hypothetical protein
MGGELVERSYKVNDPAGRKMWSLVPSKLAIRSPSVLLVSLNILVFVVKAEPRGA